MSHDSADSVIFTFGKYSGHTLGHVIINDVGYLHWIRDNDTFDPIWKEAVVKSLADEDISHLKLPRVKTNEKVPSKIKSKKVVEIVEKNKTTAKIFMPYDKSLIARFKMEVDGRKWDGEEKCWEFPLVQLPKVVSIIKVYEVKCTPKIKKLFKEIVEDKNKRHEIRSKADTDFEIPGLLLDLFPFQKVCVEFINHTNGRCLIADQPGLGKTIESIAYAKMNNLKTLIVCPLSVVINWRKEIEKFTGLPSTIWNTKTVDGELANNFHICNYDAVRKIDKELRNQKFDLLICDEATYLKNRNTLRYKSILGSYKERKKFPGIKTEHVLFLTGTPVMSRPIEAFTLLNHLDKNRFNNFFHFTQRYGGWKGVPVRNLTELHERTKDLTIRRKKSEVLEELPDKQRNDLYIDLTTAQRKEYDTLIDELFQEWTFSGKPTIGTMPKIQAYMNQQKLPRLREIINEYIDNDRSLLVFCCYIDPLKQLKEELGDKASLFHGSMKKEERQKAIDDLVHGNTKIGLFSLKAAGMGIDGLQHVIDTVVFIDADWVPANHEQAEDRVHRIGQDEKVQIFYMKINDTIDEYMTDLITEKLKMAAQIVDGEIIDAVNTKSIFGDFMSKLKHDNLFEL
jgi:SWI/SNF-related matrix-associated actin-dependent regulator of chromatin subfamily A-like protein 1